MKESDRNYAVALRLKGLSYSEILEKIPVAKSTLSIWLREVGLSKRQEQRLTQKKLDAARRGGEAKRKKRIQLMNVIFDGAKREIGKLSKRELWLIGVALYWGEGSKEKDYRPGSGIQFTNSDPQMIKVFLSWLRNVCNINEERIGFEIYLHENEIHRIPEIKNFWSKQLNISLSRLTNVYLKKNKLKTLRRNVGALYNGLVRVKISASSTLNRQVTGWIMGITDNISKYN